MSEAHQPLTAELLLSSLDLLTELVEEGHREHALRLLGALLDRVQIDNAVFERCMRYRAGESVDQLWQ